MGSGKLLSDPALVALAEKYNRSTAQICLRWCLQKGKLPLPKSTTPSRIEENLRLFDFQISKEDSDLIDGLACVGRTDRIRIKQILKCFTIWWKKGVDGI